MSTAKTTKTTKSSRDVSSEIAYLTRALKAPALRDVVSRLAERVRTEDWSHEEHLAACLQREVAARDSHGAEGRIRTARFPSRKSRSEGLKAVGHASSGTACHPPRPRVH
ncbi:hypothetical protein O7599_10340 [Streptomyces sp. WMMC500]|uniref:hypothetical protein n=1 Tax=Streptomyces sp. WMMC500 TaxID=3015154 RepID=UPI00248C3D33|nr:hypothetical protein [Streptomyces sp. WMMC500]WBB62894.1 hypothetical protein O7599_10340 [Streptomyces sp. WMMC500]